MNRKRLISWLALALAALVLVGAVVLVRQMYFGPRKISALFTSATGVYPGDDVRVSGVKVGTISSIKPEGTQSRMELKVDRDVEIPADAKAVVVAQNLVAARYVQLTPAYRNSGPTMPDNTVIPLERTAVPVEWDQVKEQLTRLATESFLVDRQGKVQHLPVSRQSGVAKQPALLVMLLIPFTTGVVYPAFTKLGFEPVRGFLADGDASRRLQLAQRLADLFDQYQVYRGDWVEEWGQGRDLIRTGSQGGARAADAVPPDSLAKVGSTSMLPAILSQAVPAGILPGTSNSSTLALETSTPWLCS